MTVLRTVDPMEEVAVEESAGLTREEKSAARELRFAELVGRQSRFLFRVAYAVVRNTQDAEDVVQDTFLKLYRTGAWERMQNEKAFLARTAWRIGLANRLARPASELDPAMPATDANSPEGEAIAADWSLTVHRLIDALPESLRQPLALSALEELTSRDIAEVMGISEGTVRTRILRAADAPGKAGGVEWRPVWQVSIGTRWTGSWMRRWQPTATTNLDRGSNSGS
jgi:RNA polymerase sigma-70 factor (ECF subfamily)